MKILMVIDNGRIGGAQKLLLSLLPPLQAKGFQFLVVILGQGQWLANALEEAQIPIKVLGLSRWDPRAVWYLWKEVRAFRPDVIHAHLLKSILASTFLPPTKTAIVIHDHQGFYPSNLKIYFPAPVVALLTAVYRLLLLRIAKIVVLTEGMKTAYQRAYGAWVTKKIAIIPNALQQSQSIENCPNVRSLLHLPSNTPIVLMVGRFSEEKRWDRFLATAQKCQLRGVAFVGVGGGPLLRKIHGLKKQEHLQNIFFTDYRDDVHCFLQQADVCVLTSERETFSLFTLEAMLHRCPIIAMRNGGTEYLVDNGETGFIVPPGDIEALCERLRFLLQNKNARRKIGEQAYAKAVRTWALPKIITQWEKLYSSLRAATH